MQQHNSSRFLPLQGYLARVLVVIVCLSFHLSQVGVLLSYTVQSVIVDFTYFELRYVLDSRTSVKLHRGHEISLALCLWCNVVQRQCSHCSGEM